MSKQVAISPKQATQKSKLQLRYEQLLTEIELKKKHQENLEAGMRIVMPKVQAEIRPLMKELSEWHRKRLIRLDEVAREIGVGRYNQEWFDDYMAEQIASNLAEKEDDELKNLYKRYAGEDFDATDNDDTIAQMMKEMMGIDVDMEEVRKKGMEEYMAENAEKIMEQMAEQQERDEQERDAAKKERQEKRKRSAKQIERETKQKEEQKMLEQDAKAIYMRLIKKYHPDRTQDENLQKDYTEISMKVTTAYQSNDFLALLKLQIEYLEDGEKDATALADDMLKRYNKLLQKQLEEMEEELESMKFSTMGLFEDFFDKNHKFSTAKFNRYKKDLESQIRQIEVDIQESFKRKKGWFKDWIAEIKAYRQQSMMEDIFASMFSKR